MAITLNASTQSGLVVSPDQSGVLQLQTGGTPGITVQTSSVQLLTNGITSLTVDSSQRVGIGTTSPTSPLQVNTSGVNTTVQINSTDANGGYGAVFSLNNTGTGGRQYGLFSTSNADGDVGGGKLKFYDFTAGATRMLIDSSGNIGMGGASPGNMLYVKKNDNTYYLTDLINSISSGNGYINRMRFENVTPNSTNSIFTAMSDVSANRCIIYANGGIYNYQGNNSNLSDRREKKNFAPAKSYLETICSIPVQTFNYIDQNHEEDDGLTLGVVAQDVQEVAPELVTETNWGTEENPKMRLSVYQTDMQYALMKCIQELKAELDTVKSELVTLKGQA